jgi:hypothetical protein
MPGAVGFLRAVANTLHGVALGGQRVRLMDAGAGIGDANEDANEDEDEGVFEAESEVV